MIRFGYLIRGDGWSSAPRGKSGHGAARHYIYGDRGVQDFDLWGFFREIPGHPFPYRRRGTHDFGPSKFGRNPDDGPYYEGRRVDGLTPRSFS